jgi:hypothetical protein
MEKYALCRQTCQGHGVFANILENDKVCLILRNPDPIKEKVSKTFHFSEVNRFKFAKTLKSK